MSVGEPTHRDGPSALGRLAAKPFIGVILLYRATLSAVLGGQCRFHPTCSAYGLDAYRRHGPIRGTVLTMARILRCQPFARRGYDPVPFWGERRQPTVQARADDAECGPGCGLEEPQSPK